MLKVKSSMCQPKCQALAEEISMQYAWVLKKAVGLVQKWLEQQPCGASTVEVARCGW